MASVARKKIKKFGEEDEVMASLADVLSFSIRLADVDFAHVVRLALEENLTTYDASYLWLARSLGIPLVSLDGKLSDAAL